jgi:hypothetical protein
MPGRQAIKPLDQVDFLRGGKNEKGVLSNDRGADDI